MKIPRLSRKIWIPLTAAFAAAMFGVVIAKFGSSGSGTSGASDTTNQSQTVAPRISQTTSQDSCPAMLLEMHGYDVTMSNAKTNIDKIIASSNPDAASYEAEKAKWTTAHQAFLQVQAQYWADNCEPSVDVTYPPLPALPSKSATPTRYAYACSLPQVGENPPGLTPSQNPGTRYSDGTPNCNCAKSVVGRLEDLKTHYSRQQVSVGPNAAKPDAILYNYYAALEAEAHKMQGLYDYFCTVNNCPVD